MAPPLTWRNVDAPDFRGSMDGLRLAGAAFDRAATGLSEGLGKFQDYRKEGAESDILNRSMGYADPAALRAAIADGSVFQGVDRSLLGRQALGALDSRAGALLAQATAQEALTHDQLNNPELRRGVVLTNDRTLQTTTNEGLMAPLQREHVQAQTGASRASAASSMASAAATGAASRRANLLFPEQLTHAQLGNQQARLNLEQDNLMFDPQLRAARAQATGAEGNVSRAAQAELERRFPELYSPGAGADPLAAVGVPAAAAPSGGAAHGSRPGAAGAAPAGGGGAGASLLPVDSPGGQLQRGLQEAAGQNRLSGTMISGYEAAGRTNESPSEAVKKLREGSYAEHEPRVIQQWLDDIVQRSGGRANYAQARLMLENAPTGQGLIMSHLPGIVGGGGIVPNTDKVDQLLNQYSRGQLSERSEATQTLDLNAQRLGVAQRLADQARLRAAQIAQQPNVPADVVDRYKSQAELARTRYQALYEEAAAPQRQPQWDPRGAAGSTPVPGARPIPGLEPVARVDEGSVAPAAALTPAPVAPVPVATSATTTRVSPVGASQALADAVAEVRQGGSRPLGVIAGAHGVSRRALQKALDEATAR